MTVGAKDRLIVEVKFLHHDGGAQIAFDEAAAALVAVHVLVEGNDRIAPDGLALVERQIGLRHQVVRLTGMQRRDSKARRGAVGRHGDRRSSSASTGHRASAGRHGKWPECCRDLK